MLRPYGVWVRQYAPGSGKREQAPALHRIAASSVWSPAACRRLRGRGGGGVIGTDALGAKTETDYVSGDSAQDGEVVQEFYDPGN
jgi:hypothetical protein